MQRRYHARQYAVGPGLAILLFLTACTTPNVHPNQTLTPTASQTVETTVIPRTLAPSTLPAPTIPVPQTRPPATVEPAPATSTVEPGGSPPPTQQPPLPSPTQAPSSTPTVAATVGERPVILSFTAEPARANPGDEVRLAWTSQGGSQAMVSHYRPDRYPSQINISELQPTGSLTIPLGYDEQERHYFELVVTNESGDSSVSTISVELPCLLMWFFPTPADWQMCPGTPTVYFLAAEQLFEGGRMLWLKNTDMVYTLPGDGTSRRAFSAYADTWEPVEPEYDPSIVPPEGRFQPIRGFGKVWREVPGVRDQFGWALAPERGYLSSYEESWRVTDLGVHHIFASTDEGQTIGLWGQSMNVSATWEFVTP